MSIFNFQNLKKYLLGVTVVVFQGFLCTSANAGQEKENDVKAAILFNLARFSKWEQWENSSDVSQLPQVFKICTPTDDPMASSLENFSGADVHGRNIVVFEIEVLPTSPDQCHILFLSDSNWQSVDLSEMARIGILTVSDNRNFLKNDGAILIRRIRKKVRFSVNRKVMSEVKVRPSSRILSLSRGRN